MQQNNKTKNQHYIPQSYLRLFSDDGKNIWVYDKFTQTINNQNIKGTGSIKRFYQSRRYSQPLDIPPVTSLEGTGIKIIKKIDNNENVTPEEGGQLLNFIALQYLRTPAAKKRSEVSFQSFWNGLRKVYRESKFQNQKIEKIAKSYIDDQKIEGATPQQFLKNNDSITPPEELFVDTLVGSGFNIAEILSKQKWEILFSKPNSWVTSDDPFSVLGKEDGNLFPPLVPETEKIIPLSKNSLLVICGAGFKIEMKLMHPWSVEVINLATASRAERYVYSGNKDLLEDIKKNLFLFEKNPESFTEKIPKDFNDWLKKGPRTLKQ